MLRRPRAAAMALFLLAGCTKTEPPPPAAAPPAEAAPPTANAAPGARVPSFKREIQPWMQVHCAEAKNCHGASPAWTVELDLRAGAAYKALVNEPAERRLDTMRVKPGDPDQSFLIAKLNGKLRPREGKTMPLDPRTGKPTQPVPEDPDFLEHALLPWIRAGAPNN